MGAQESIQLKQSQIRPCGCYIRRPQQIDSSLKEALVPLRHIDYQLEIVNSLVSITLTQKYFNSTDKFLEVDYAMPVNPESSIYRFEAEFGNVKIQGIVKEKQKAKKQYQEAKSKGKQAVISTIDPDSKDILNMEIGNIPPQTELTITIALLQELSVSQSTFYRLQIPSTISPRFMNSVEGVAKVTEFLRNKGWLSGKPDYDWTFKIDLKTSRKVVFFDSPSHDITLLSQNEQGTQTLLAMEKLQIPNKDFTFLFTTQDFHLPSYVMGSTDCSSTVMLSFIPKFCTLDITDAYKAEIDSKPCETDISAARGQYIFFLDRSHSMGGKRMVKAKEALILFLKSLPNDSYFNVVSFGTRSESMFPRSQKYGEMPIQYAIRQIQSMKANLGGTFIFDSLKRILLQRNVEDYLKQIYLLTDGGVKNSNQVVEMVKQSVKRSRVNTIGIGQGASIDLIINCALAGKGKHVMISDDQNPAEKIIELLEATLTPLISKVQLTCDQLNEVESIVPNPKSIPYILKDEAANFFVTFKGPLTSKRVFTFQYEDSATKLPSKVSIEVHPSSLNQPFVDKMAHFKVLRALESAAKSGVNVEQHMHYVKVKDNKEEAINYSLKHQVLSEYTAFLCVGKDLVDDQVQQFQSKGLKKVQVQSYQPLLKPIPKKPQLLKVKKNAQKCKSQSRQRLKFNKKISYYEQRYCSQMNMEQQQSIPKKRIKYSRQQQDDKGLESYNQLNMLQHSEFRNFATPTYSSQLNINQFTQSSQPYQFSQFSQINNQLQTSRLQFSNNYALNKSQFFDVNGIIRMQLPEGHWDNIKIIEHLAKNINQLVELCKQIGVSVVVTHLVILFMRKYHPEKQYALIIKKSQNWLKKALRQKGLSEQVLQTILLK